VSLRVPEDAVYVLFGITIAGPGRIELRNAELVPALRSSPQPHLDQTADRSGPT
jgi:hypothetical protein